MRLTQGMADMIFNRLGRDAQSQCNFLVRATVKDTQLEGGPTLGVELFDRFPQ